jgi:cyanophycinase-like exopeptidase
MTTNEGAYPSAANNVLLGGGGTTPTFTRAANDTVKAECEQCTPLTGDLTEQSDFPEGMYIEFNIHEQDNHTPAVKNDGAYFVNDRKLTPAEQDKILQWTGLTAAEFDVLYRPYLLPPGSTVRLYFLEDEQNGDGTGRVYFRESKGSLEYRVESLGYFLERDVTNKQRDKAWEIVDDLFGERTTTRTLANAITKKYGEAEDPFEVFLADVQKHSGLPNDHPLKTYKSSVKTYLIPSRKTENLPEILEHIHPALKEVVGDKTDAAQHQVLVLALPSGTYPRVHEAEMRVVYKALGVPEDSITIVDTDLSPDDRRVEAFRQLEERLLAAIEKATIIDISGGDQKRLERFLKYMPAVAEALREKVTDPACSLITTSASCAVAGSIMIADVGDIKNPLIVSRFNESDCGTWVATALGIIPSQNNDEERGIVTETHLMGEKKVTTDEVLSTGRDRVSRILATLLTLPHLFPSFLTANLCEVSLKLQPEQQAQAQKAIKRAFDDSDLPAFDKISDVNFLAPRIEEKRYGGEYGGFKEFYERVVRDLPKNHPFITKQDEIFDVCRAPLPLGIAATEGTFANVHHGKLRVISDHDLGGVFIIDPLQFKDWKVTFSDRGRVAELTSVTAVRTSDEKDAELIWDKQTIAEQGKPGCRLTTSRNKWEGTDGYRGAGLLYNGEEINLQTLEITRVRLDMMEVPRAFSLAKNCVFVNAQGEEASAAEVSRAMLAMANVQQQRREAR